MSTGDASGKAELLATSPELTRDQPKALWLHRAVAGRLVADPDAVWLGHWRTTLAEGERRAVLESFASTWREEPAAAKPASSIRPDSPNEPESVSVAPALRPAPALVS